MAYRRVETTMWDDEKFIGLSTPLTKLFFIHLFTGPHTTMLPGLIVAGLGTLMDSFRHDDFETVSAAMAELTVKELVQVDRTLRVIRLPNAPRFNAPTNANVVRGWWGMFKTIPNSPLKWQHVASLKAVLPTKTKGATSIRAAWNETFGTLGANPEANPAVNPDPSPAANPKTRPDRKAAPDLKAGSAQGRGTQEQEQLQDQIQDREHSAARADGEPPPELPAVPAPPDEPPASQPAPPADDGASLPWKGAPPIGPAQQAVLKGLWQGYHDSCDPLGEQEHGAAYHYQIHGERISKALRSEPLCRYANPADVLAKATAAFASDPLRAGVGKLGKRQFRHWLLPANLTTAIDRARAHARGVDPDALPDRARQGAPAQPTPPRPDYKPPEAPEGESGPDDPAARAANRQRLAGLTSHALNKPEGTPTT